MRLFALGILLTTAGAVDAAEAERRFPYEAVVHEETEVRSGPGHKFYATGRLAVGSRVVVRRHDPGGWYMISPPEGSFSWVPADQVAVPPGGKIGTIVESGVPARVGSQFDDSSEVWQRQLSKGETVQILEKGTLETPLGPAAMYKISPPKGEFRWIPGQSCAPPDQFQSRPAGDAPFAAPTNDPFAQPKRTSPTPSSPATTADPTAESFLDIPTVDQTPQPATTAKPARTASNQQSTYDDDQAQLQELDRRMREMLKREPSDWDFTELDSQYRDLQQRSQHPAIQRHLKGRLASLDKYRAIEQNFKRFIQLTSSTEQRDEALRARIEQPHDSSGTQFQELPHLSARPPGDQFSPPAPPALVDPGASASPQLLNAPVPTQTQPLPPQTQVTPPPPIPAAAPKFDGVGIVQRSATASVGGPMHVLLAPNGQILAYLEGMPGVNLEQFVGQPAGVYGDRGFRNDLQSDFITVRGLMPVQLADGDG